MRILCKIGGAALEQAASRAKLVRDVQSAREAGHEVIVVHGGGNQIGALSERLGLEVERHAGLRITTPEVAEVVLCVLAGTVNKALVAQFVQAGVPAVGLTGADGDTFRARKFEAGDVDLGLVGEIATVQPALVESLIADASVPVIATTAPAFDQVPFQAESFYNINADAAAGTLSRAFGVDALVFLTDVVAVRGPAGDAVAELNAAQVSDWKANGTLQGGMLPKLGAALAALESVDLVKIASSAASDALLAALEVGHGTQIKLGAKQAASHG